MIVSPGATVITGGMLEEGWHWNRKMRREKGLPVIPSKMRLVALDRVDRHEEDGGEREK